MCRMSAFSVEIKMYHLYIYTWYLDESVIILVFMCRYVHKIAFIKGSSIFMWVTYGNP